VRIAPPTLMTANLSAAEKMRRYLSTSLREASEYNSLVMVSLSYAFSRAAALEYDRTTGTLRALLDSTEDLADEAVAMREVEAVLNHR